MFINFRFMTHKFAIYHNFGIKKILACCILFFLGGGLLARALFLASQTRCTTTITGYKIKKTSPHRPHVPEPKHNEETYRKQEPIKEESIAAAAYSPTIPPPPMSLHRRCSLLRSTAAATRSTDSARWAISCDDDFHGRRRSDLAADNPISPLQRRGSTTPPPRR